MIMITRVTMVIVKRYDNGNDGNKDEDVGK